MIERARKDAPPVKLLLLNASVAITAGLVIAVPDMGLEFVLVIYLLLTRHWTVSYVAHETRRHMIGAAIRCGKRAARKQHVPAD